MSLTHPLGCCYIESASPRLEAGKTDIRLGRFRRSDYRQICDAVPCFVGSPLRRNSQYIQNISFLPEEKARILKPAEKFINAKGAIIVFQKNAGNK
jgi:hypothetical protein